MCIKDSDLKYKLKCTIIAVVSLVVHIVLSCGSITALTMSIYKKPYNLQEHLQQNSSIYFGKMDKRTFLTVFGALLFLGVLGSVASIILLIGSKYNKPGYVVVYICYSVQLGIILLIGGLLLFLKLHWNFAISVLCLLVLSCFTTMTVYRSYEVMMLEILRENSITDLTLLIQEDLSDDSLIELSE